ncbi:MAG TPA: hypothetical protein VGF59_21125 [Bryobacteraceae bacterium]
MNLPCVGCVAPVFRQVFAVARYTPDGLLLHSFAQELNGLLEASVRPTLLAQDSHGHIYVGGVDDKFAAVLVRAGEFWPNELTGLQFEPDGIAFDLEDNPVFCGTAADGIRILKLDRTTGKILADRHFGSQYDRAAAIAADRGGGVYVTGFAGSLDFPVTPGAFQTERPPNDGGYIGFVMKLDGSLQRLAYSTLLGAGFGAFPSSIAVWTDGSAYVAGSSLTFFGEKLPTTPGVYQPHIPSNRRPYYNGMFLTGPTAGFVTRLAPDGSGLIASTYLAGNYTDFATTVRVDADSNVTVVGGTASSDFVSTAPSACGPRGDGGLFVTKLDGLLQRVISSAILPQQSARGASTLLPDGSLYIGAVISLSDAVGSNEGRVVRVNPNGAAPPVACVVNGASFLVENAAAPGQLLTIFGEGLEGAEVVMGGRSAPILATAAGQINVVVPFDAPDAGDLPVEVRRAGRTLFSWQLSAVPQNPTPLLRFDADGPVLSENVQPVVPLADAVNEDGTPNSKDHPAAPGSIVTIYATGYGRIGADASHPAYLIPQIYTYFGYLTPIDVSTIPGRTQAVVAVKVRVPSGVFFRLCPSVNLQVLATDFIY